MFSFFFKKEKINPFPLRTDIHSHLIPGIDDGVTSFENAREVILKLQESGYKKLITTPHIISDTYKNTPEIILNGLRELNLFLLQNNIDIKIEAAAEYYLDTWLISEVNDGNLLLTFADKYLLFEMNYITEPYQLNDFIFSLTTKGYRPVLAHPERYQFMTLEKAEDLRDRGVLLQLNILSLIGFYSKPVQSMANKLVNNRLVDFLGSDCHNLRQASLIPEAFKNKYLKKVLNLPLHNNLL
ncbi:MAG: capsular biosynthesis protein [Bacteroidetes bacterium]|nr:capsular biosynthesis protein [Bacteroidota bacterium]MBI3481688.1 capsular biosynthesis protein [Bacteroidota bacterium]